MLRMTVVVKALLEVLVSHGQTDSKLGPNTVSLVRYRMLSAGRREVKWIPKKNSRTKLGFEFRTFPLLVRHLAIEPLGPGGRGV